MVLLYRPSIEARLDRYRTTYLRAVRKYSTTARTKKIECTIMEVLVSSSAARTSICVNTYTNKTAIFPHLRVILANISKV